MSRLPRFFLPDVPLHVIQRGNDRSPIFVDRNDYVFFLRCLKDAACKCSVRLHAYVLMSNHVHLLATPQFPASMPKMMQSIGRIFVQYFNIRYQKTGTRWEGRYKATAVHDDRYLLTCMRYIELNPVRAGIVTAPGEYRWSSFRANALGERDDLVVPHPILHGLGESPGRRRAAYQELFGCAIPEDELRAIRDATHNAWALGGTQFQRLVSAGGRRAARARRGRPSKELGSDSNSQSFPKIRV